MPADTELIDGLRHQIYRNHAYSETCDGCLMSIKALRKAEAKIMNDGSKYEIHYRFAEEKITVHLRVDDLDDLLKQLTRLKDEGIVKILGVSLLESKQ